MTMAFGSDEFMSLSKRRQNELIFSILSPLARLDFGSEIEWLRNRRNEITEKLDILEKSISLQDEAHSNHAFNFKSPVSSKHETQFFNDIHQNHKQFSSRTSETVTWLNSTTIEQHCSNNSSPISEQEPSIDDIERANIIKSRKIYKKVVLNVGGVKHEVMWKMLERQPRSRLGLLAAATNSSEILSLCDGFSLDENEYYFDRHPKTFNCILNFYRTGRLHVLEELCVIDFSQDLEYWKIDEVYLEACCEGKFTGRKEHVTEEVIKNTKVMKEVEKEEHFGSGPCARYQKCLWDVMEKPNSSVFAKVLSLFSISLVLISTLGMCLNTMPEFKHQLNGQQIDNPYFALIEAYCISWFTIEYFLRLAGAPNKWQFLKGPMNVIDVLAILPYYLSLIFGREEDLSLMNFISTENGTLLMIDSNGTFVSQLPPGFGITGLPPQEVESTESEFEDMSRLLQAFRIARIMRIFKLARSSSGLQAIAHTMKSSYKELSLLLLFVGMGMLIFGSLAYFMEKDVIDSKYTSIPEAMWWAIQTMTSVGYGDLSPTTIMGKLVGSACGISGVLVMALPIPIVVENFGAYYMEQKKREAISKKREDLAELRKSNNESFKLERENLLDVLSGDPGPFKTNIPDSPEEEKHQNGSTNQCNSQAT